jgi:hypothetical protein
MAVLLQANSGHMIQLAANKEVCALFVIKSVLFTEKQ